MCDIINCFDVVLHKLYFIVDPRHFVVNVVSDLQELRHRHHKFFICQSVELLQPILQVRPPRYSLHEFFCTNMSSLKCIRKNGRTRLVLFHFLCGRREDTQDFNCYFNHFVCHRRSQRDVGISLEAPEKTFNASEDVDENILARGYIFCRLRTRSIRRVRMREWTHTPKGELQRQQKPHVRVRIPGESTYQRAVLLIDELIFTKPTPAPSVPEKT